MYNEKVKVKMLRALKKHKGLISTAAKACGINRATHYAWYSNDEDYKTKVDELMDLEVEYVESKLQNLIEMENPSAVQFYLKNKSDNYRDKLKIEAEVSGEIKINAIFNNDLLLDADGE